MIPALWPSQLPNPNRSGYQTQLQDSRLRRSGEQGPPGYRRGWSAVPCNVSLSIEVTRADKAAFDLFYERTTSFGTLPFWMPDPTTDGWLLLDDQGQPIQDQSGTQILLAARWLCVFGDSTPIFSIRGVRFGIAFNVVVMP